MKKYRKLAYLLLFTALTLTNLSGCRPIINSSYDESPYLLDLYPDTPGITQEVIDDYHRGIADAQRPLLIVLSVSFLCVISLVAVLFIRSRRTGMKLGLLVKEQTAELEMQTVALEMQTAALALRQRDLEIAYDAAEAANRSKSIFLANMSHEIRTPMNAIMGITDILIQNESLTDEVSEGLEKIYTSSDMLLGIINDILDFSKIEAGKLAIMPAQYKVASLINDSAQLNIMRIADKPITFEIQVDENIPTRLVGDEIRIKQILNNLLSNAFKYTASGKVVLNITCKPDTDAKSTMLIINVSDTGQGMSSRQLEKLFDEYSRFNEKTNRTIEGTGLGLTITAQLISLMNGIIDVESKKGKGSSFTVSLPQEIVDDEVLGKEVTENLRSFHQKNTDHRVTSKFVRNPMPYGRVLIVDDTETNLYVAVRLLKFYKLWIDTAINAGDAIRKIRDGKEYDIIFMDHMMPEMDGIEATGILRNSGYTGTIVALTANAVAGQADIFLKNGFNAFISKPIDIRQLDTILNKFIKEKQTPEVIEAARIQIAEAEEKSKTEALLSIEPLLIESFTRDAGKTMTMLTNMLESPESFENDEYLRMFTINIHGIKSSLANIGETDLSKTALLLEQASRDKNIKLIMDEINNFIEKLSIILEKVMHISAGNDTGTDSLDLDDKLIAAKNMCADYDRNGALDALSSVQSCCAETKKVLDIIKELVAQSEYDEAANAIGLFLDNRKKDTQSLLDFQIDGLDINKGVISYNGDEHAYIKILRSYVASVRLLLTSISKFNPDNIIDYKIKVHGIKGASYDIFAEQTGTHASALEKAADNKDLAYIRAHNPSFIRDTTKFIDCIDQMLSAIKSNFIRPSKDKIDEELISKLIEACTVYNMDGVEEAMDEIDGYQYETDSDLVEWLHENVDLIKFTQIIERLSPGGRL